MAACRSLPRTSSAQAAPSGASSTSAWMARRTHSACWAVPQGRVTSAVCLAGPAAVADAGMAAGPGLLGLEGLGDGRALLVEELRAAVGAADADVLRVELD